MKPLLLLHLRADVNTNDIWRAAIQAGWSTERVDMTGRVTIPSGTKVRYYGNTLHGHIIEDKLPIRFLPLDLRVLAETPLTKRHITLMTAGDLDQVRNDSPLFIKPAQNKWFPAKVYQPSESPKRAQGGAGLPSDFIYCQEPVDMINEVRCFCLDGRILTASYYRIGHEYCPVGIDGVDRPKVLDEMVTELAPRYPRGVVLDFAYLASKEWCFIEPNEAWASGIYGCDPTRCLEVIEASQEDK